MKRKKRIKLTLVSIRHAGYDGVEKRTNTVVDKFVIIGERRNIEEKIQDELKKDREILKTNDTIVANGYRIKSTYKINGEFFVDGCIDNFTDND